MASFQRRRGHSDREYAFGGNDEAKELRTKLQECETQRDQFAYSNKAQERVIQNLIGEKNSLQEEVNALRKYSDWDQPVIFVNSRAEIVERRLTEVLAKERDDAKKKLKEANAKLEMNQNRLESSGAAANSPLEGSIEPNKTGKSGEEVKRLKGEVDKLQNQIKELQAQNQRLGGELSGMDEQVEKFASATNAAEEDSAKAIAEAKAAKEELATVKTRVAEQDQLMSSLSAANSSTEQSLTELHNLNIKQRGEISGQRDEITRLKAKIQELEAGR